MRSNILRAVAWRAQLVLAAIAAAAPIATAPATAASVQGAQAVESPQELRRTRSKSWWLDYWAHSMQERAFIEWMHQSTGSTAWMHVMPIGQVNALYAWWLSEIWFGSGGSPPP